MATKKETAAAVEEVKTVEEKKPAPKKTAKKAEKKKTLTIKLVRSFAHRLDSQIATCKSLGLKKIGDVTVQPDNACTRGKLAKVAHMVEVTE